jgi:outer membrane protein OmpA-like peptidoglycan-associated protein
MTKSAAVRERSARRRALAGAAFVLIASLASGPARIIARAHADPAYRADAVIYFFTHEAGRLCIGTKAECPATTSEGRFVLVNFEPNSDQLTPIARENLDQFAKALKDPRLSWRRFEIDGHTDAAGAECYNGELSERRASSVAAYLAAQGLPSLTTRGFGKSKPLVTDAFSPKNRRVEARALDSVR